MTRADIIQIIFGIHAEEMDTIKDLLRTRCGNYSDCTNCEYNESENNPLCFAFWIEPVADEEWKDSEQRFRILYNAYRLGHNRGYLKGEKHQHELESEGKNDSN